MALTRTQATRNGVQTPGRGRTIPPMPRPARTLAPPPPASRGPVVVGSVAVALLLVALATRLPDLGHYANTDVAHVWYGRIRRFWASFVAGRYEGTFQLHPGVTLMWLSGGAIQLGPGLGPELTAEALRVGARPVAIVGAIAAPLTFLFWRAAAGPRHFWPAALAGLLVATEPQLVGHARTIHLDAMAATFCWLAVLAAAVAIRRGTWRWATVAGICLGLGVLTRGAGGTIAMGVALWFVLAAAEDRRRLPRYAGLLAVTAGVALAVFFASWPALWQDPAGTLELLRSEGRRMAGSAHKTFFWGRYYRKDPGLGFYPRALLVRFTPEVLVGGAIGVFMFAGRAARRGLVRVQGRRGALRWALLGLLCAYGPYILILLVTPKKLDRYALPLLPPLCLLAAYGILGVVRRIRPPTLAALLVAFGLVAGWRAVRLARVHPFPITWATDLPGRPAERALMLGWGEGLREAGRFIAADAAARGAAPPRVWSRYWHNSLRPFLPDYEKSRIKRAEYIVRYLPNLQRGWSRDDIKANARGLLHTVELGGRGYVWVLAGPRYTGPTEARPMDGLFPPRPPGFVEKHVPFGRHELLPGTWIGPGAPPDDERSR